MIWQKTRLDPNHSAGSLRGIVPDPDDDAVIATALAAGAEWVVIGDKPLPGVVAHQGVRVLGVGEAVERILAKDKT